MIHHDYKSYKENDDKNKLNKKKWGGFGGLTVYVLTNQLTLLTFHYKS